MYEQTFQEFVLQYVVDWEQTIVDRIVSSLEKAEKLRLEVDHYQEKVKSLSSSDNDWSSIILGRSSSDEPDSERIQRNKNKYQDARNAYALYAKDLRLLIEEVTDRGWRDLFPVLMKLFLFESSLASDEEKILSELIPITTGMSEIAKRYSLSPEPRIDDLETADPHELSTRSLEFAGDKISGRSSLYEDDDASDANSGPGDECSIDNPINQLEKKAVIIDDELKLPSVRKSPDELPKGKGGSANVTPEKRVTFAIDETPKARGSRRLEV